MAGAHVQTTSGSDSGSAGGAFNLTAFGTATTSGNLIEVTVGFRPANAGESVTVSDNKGNTYVRAVVCPASPASFDFVVEKWYAKNIVGGSSHQVTVTQSGSNNTAVAFAEEISGLDTSAPLDKTAIGTTFASSVTTASTGTLSQADEFATTGCYAQGANDPTVGGAFTSLGAGVSVGSNNYVESAYLVVSATTALTATWTTSGSATLSAVIVTYKAYVPPPYVYISTSWAGFPRAVPNFAEAVR